MGYVNAMKTAIFIFPFVAFLFTIPFILHNYHKYGSINPLRVGVIYSFILYMITIYFLVILPLPDWSEVTGPISDMVRLVPFSFVGDFMKESSFVITNPATYGKAILEPCFYVVIFNIFMTVPFGMYLRYYFKCNLKKVITYSFLLSLFFEITQITGLYFIYPYPYRVFDVDDLILNTLGGIIGYYLMGMVRKLLPSRDRMDEESKEVGKKVSALRRITVLCLDFFLYGFCALFIKVFFRIPYSNELIFILYYIIGPITSGGYTLGSKFLNVKIEFLDHTTMRTVIRSIFSVCYYIGLPYIILFFTVTSISRLDLPSMETILIYLMVFFSVFLFYLGHVLALLIHKKMYYDDLFKVKFISTIGKEKGNGSIKR